MTYRCRRGITVCYHLSSARLLNQSIKIICKVDAVAVLPTLKQIYLHICQNHVADIFQGR